MSPHGRYPTPLKTCSILSNISINPIRRPVPFADVTMVGLYEVPRAVPAVRTNTRFTTHRTDGVVTLGQSRWIIFLLLRFIGPLRLSRLTTKLPSSSPIGTTSHLFNIIFHNIFPAHSWSSQRSFTNRILFNHCT